MKIRDYTKKKRTTKKKHKPTNENFIPPFCRFFRSFLLWPNFEQSHFSTYLSYGCDIPMKMKVRVSAMRTPGAKSICIHQAHCKYENPKFSKSQRKVYIWTPVEKFFHKWAKKWMTYSEFENQGLHRSETPNSKKKNIL